MYTIAPAARAFVKRAAPTVVIVLVVFHGFRMMMTVKSEFGCFVTVSAVWAVAGLCRKNG